MAHLHLSRRALLTSAAASGILLTGCTDPRITGSHAPADRPSPTLGATPSLAHREALVAENEAAALFTACASASLTWDAPAGFSAWCTAASAQCLSHVQFLGGPVLLPPASTPLPPASTLAPSSTPSPAAPRTGATTSPEASASPAKDLATARAAIEKQLGKVSADHRQRCLASTAGDEALLWASMAVAAHAVRRQATPPVPGDTTPTQTRVGSRDQAVVVLLSQVRALVYGLEVGMGVLSISSKEFASARTRLTQVLVLRDSLLEQISSTSLSPPPVELAYAMPGDLTTSATIRSTWGALENGVLAGWARLAAASPPRRRPAALDAMQQQADRVQGLGVSLTYWPGWVGGDVG